ncbi:hypothetical protein [Ignavibacterium album]|nr:hypothetical protein [Ignavibacterium album]
MNLSTKIILFFILPVFSILAQDCHNVLKINSDITEANIYLNDSLVSDNGKIELELQDGEYILVANEISDRWNSKSFSDTISISGCEQKNIYYYFKTETLLESIPEDAYVFANDSLIGFTPLKVPNDFRELRITKPGYLEQKIFLSENSPKLVKLDFNGSIKSEPFVNTTMFKVLTGSAIVLGAVTAYFKLEADDKFDEYRFSGNKKFLDETNRYDTISGISLALFQINFGYIIYRFLAE